MRRVTSRVKSRSADAITCQSGLFFDGIAQMVSASDFDSDYGCSNHSAVATGHPRPPFHYFQAFPRKGQVNERSVWRAALG